MKQHMYAEGDYVYYLGRLYRIIWATATRLKLQLAGSYGAGMSPLGPSTQPFYYNQEIAKVGHWSLYRCPK